jgi:hypothetical protein
VELCQEYLIEVFYTYCKRPYHKKYQNVFNAECPICKEGKSAGRSRRLYYFPNKQYFYCHNCSRSWRPVDWVKDVTNLTIGEILKKNDEKLNIVKLGNYTEEQKSFSIIKEIPDLPENSIDLTDEYQYDYFSSNRYVQIAKEYCKSRHLLSAVNSCKKFYISLEDKIHKNRLIIPFFDENQKIVCYQTRALTEKQFPRYLTKQGEKHIFNFNNIDSSIPYVFIFEGPIDSMFVKNGVALAALSATQKQKEILGGLLGYQLIYVFDNDKNNKQTQKRIEKHVKEGNHIFIWPKELSSFKDFNEVCCKLNLDEIPWKFVVKHSEKELSAEIKLKLARA